MKSIAITLALCSTVAAQTGPAGIVGQPAPSWGDVQWLNLPDGASTLDVGDYRGRVVYLFGFQSW